MKECLYRCTSTIRWYLRVKEVPSSIDRESNKCSVCTLASAEIHDEPATLITAAEDGYLYTQRRRKEHCSAADISNGSTKTRLPAYHTPILPSGSNFIYSRRHDTCGVELAPEEQLRCLKLERIDSSSMPTGSAYQQRLTDSRRSPGEDKEYCPILDPLRACLR